MDQLAGLLLIPAIITIGIAVAFKTTITLKEACVQVAVVFVVMTCAFFIVRHHGLSDTEHLNGRVTRKLSGSQKCCHCHDVCVGRDSKGNCTSTVEVCSHFRDYWWSLDTSLGRIPMDCCSTSNGSSARQRRRSGGRSWRAIGTFRQSSADPWLRRRT